MGRKDMELGETGWGGTALREKAGGKEEKGAEPFSHLNVSECGSAPRALHSTEDSTFS